MKTQLDRVSQRAQRKHGGHGGIALCALWAALCGLCVSCWAQTAKTRATLYTDIDTLFASGSAITAAELRTGLKDVVASAQNGLTDGTAITATGSYANPLWLTSLAYAKLTGAPVAGINFAPPTSGTSLLYGNGAGGFSNATIGGNLTFSAGTLNLSTTPNLGAATGTSLFLSSATDATDATGSTGSLGTLGGLSVAQTIYGGGDVVLTGENKGFYAGDGLSGSPRVALNGGDGVFAGPFFELRTNGAVRGTLATSNAIGGSSSDLLLNSALGAVNIAAGGISTTLGISTTAITAAEVMRITDATDATDATGTTGSLGTLGGLSAAQTIYGGGDVVLTGENKGFYAGDGLSGSPRVGLNGGDGVFAGPFFELRTNGAVRGGLATSNAIGGSSSDLLLNSALGAVNIAAGGISTTLGISTTAITAAEVMRITDATDATDATGTTGSLGTLGGLSVAKKIYSGSTITATGAVTGSNLSGTNTGDQTITLTGDVTGSGTGSFATTLATVPVAKGGTGATTLTANNVLLGNGTSAVQFVAPGTSGNVMTSNGSTWTSAAPSGGGGLGLNMSGGTGATLAPADSTSYYFGANAAVSTGSGSHRYYITKTGTVKSAYVYWHAYTTAGSTESFTVFFRLNDATDTAIASVADGSAGKLFSSTGLAIEVNAGEFFEIKITTPAWVTNPSGVRLGFVVYME